MRVQDSVSPRRAERRQWRAVGIDRGFLGDLTTERDWRDNRIEAVADRDEMMHAFDSCIIEVRFVEEEQGPRVPFIPREALAPREMADIAISPCGCVTAVLATDVNPEERLLIQRSGRRLERVSIREARERFAVACAHAGRVAA